MSDTVCRAHDSRRGNEWASQPYRQLARLIHPRSQPRIGRAAASPLTPAVLYCLDGSGSDRQVRSGRAGDGRRAGAPAIPIALAVAAFVALTAAALTTSCSSGSDESSPPAGAPAPSASATTLGAAAPLRPSDAVNTAASFLAALARGRYQEMWAFLADAPRRQWGDFDALASFLQRKFGGRELGIQVGEAEPPAPWRDPDTGATYDGAVTVPYTLRAEGHEVEEFALAPLILVQEAGQWRVAGLGPAGRRAPAFAPPPTNEATLTVPILVYHHVAPEWPADFEGRTITVLSSDFEAELAYMREAGYTSITLAELANALFYGLPLPDKPVIMTFDDGYEDNFVHAFPLLQKYGFVGSFAVVTGFLDHAGYMTWDEVRQMADAGMEFASHSANHVDLGAAAPDQAAAELRDSRKAIQEKVGRPAQALVYPYGEPFAHGSVEAQDRVTELLRQEGYVLGVTNPLPNTWPEVKQDAAAPYRLKRVMVSGGMGLIRFAARLEGREPQ